MIATLREIQNWIGRAVFCLIVLGTMMVDRISQASGAALVATGTDTDPQQSLVRLVTVLIGCSLSMMALGYRARV
jgi:hypothetical protein